MFQRMFRKTKSKAGKTSETWMRSYGNLIVEEAAAEVKEAAEVKAAETEAEVENEFHPNLKLYKEVKIKEVKKAKTEAEADANEIKARAKAEKEAREAAEAEVEAKARKTRDEIEYDDVRGWTHSYSSFVNEFHAKLCKEYLSCSVSDEKHLLEPVINELVVLAKIINDDFGLSKVGEIVAAGKAVAEAKTAEAIAKAKTAKAIAEGETAEAIAEAKATEEKAKAKSAEVIAKAKSAEVKANEEKREEKREEKVALPAGEVELYFYMRDRLQACVFKGYLDIYVHQRTKPGSYSKAGALQKKYEEALVSVSRDSGEDILCLQRKKVLGKNEIDSKILNVVEADTRFDPELKKQLNEGIFKDVIKTLALAIAPGQEHAIARNQLGFINLLKAFYRMNQRSQNKKDANAVRLWNEHVEKITGNLDEISDYLDKEAKLVGTLIEREKVRKFVNLLKMEGARDFGETTKYGLKFVFKDLCMEARNSGSTVYNISMVLTEYAENQRSAGGDRKLEANGPRLLMS